MCRKRMEHTGSSTYVYGYDDGMVEELSDFILEGEIDPERMRAEDQIIAVANVDGQGELLLTGKSPAIPSLSGSRKWTATRMNCCVLRTAAAGM